MLTYATHASHELLHALAAGTEACCGDTMLFGCGWSSLSGLPVIMRRRTLADEWIGGLAEGQPHFAVPHLQRRIFLRGRCKQVKKLHAKILRRYPPQSNRPSSRGVRLAEVARVAEVNGERGYGAGGAGARRGGCTGPRARETFTLDPRWQLEQRVPQTKRPPSAVGSGTSNLELPSGGTIKFAPRKVILTTSATIK
jgi:hypothetical protein